MLRWHGRRHSKEQAPLPQSSQSRDAECVPFRTLFHSSAAPHRVFSVSVPLQGLAKSLRGRKLTTAWFSSSKQGITSSRRSTLSTSSTRPPGHSNLRSPPCSRSEAHVLAMMLRPELSSWCSSARFNRNLRPPLAINSCRRRPRYALSLSPMVALPQRSSIVTSPAVRIVIRSATTSLASRSYSNYNSNQIHWWRFKPWGIPVFLLLMPPIFPTANLQLLIEHGWRCRSTASILVE